MLNLDEDAPLAVVAIGAIRSGDVEELRRLLKDRPDLAAARITRERGFERDALLLSPDRGGNRLARPLPQCFSDDTRARVGRR